MDSNGKGNNGNNNGNNDSNDKSGNDNDYSGNFDVTKFSGEPSDEGNWCPEYDGTDGPL